MKCLIVGLGSIGQRHVRNLRTLLGDSVKISAYRTRRLGHVVTERLQLEPASDVEEKYGIRAHTDLDVALAERPDAVFVCNPSALHIPTARAAAEAGCHIFLEKPLSHDYAGVDDLIAVTERKRLITFVGFQLRFHPCIVRMHELLHAGAVGAVIAARAEVGEHLPSWHPYEDYRQLYAARRDLGGGVILSQIHELDYLYSFFGLPRRVFALGGHLSNLEIDVEDTASILLECSANGRRFPVHLHEDYLQRPPSRKFEVIGDGGKLLLDFHTVTLHHYDGDGALAERFSPENFDRNNLYLDELRHFLACVDGRATSRVTVRDASYSLRMALAARESLENRAIVELDP